MHSCLDKVAWYSLRILPFELFDFFGLFGAQLSRHHLELDWTRPRSRVQLVAFLDPYLLCRWVRSRRTSSSSFFSDAHVIFFFLAHAKDSQVGSLVHIKPPPDLISSTWYATCAREQEHDSPKVILSVFDLVKDPVRTRWSDLAAAVGSRKICWSCRRKKLKDPARMTKSSRRDLHGRRQLTRVNSTNVLDEGLWIGGRATTRDSGIEIGIRCTQVHVPAVEDRTSC
jgi:hypothetical protein